VEVKPIRTEEDCDAALMRIEELWDADSGTTGSDELEVLSILVEDYEEKHHRVPPPDPIAAITYRMEQLGMRRADLTHYIGHRGRVAEVLNRKRGLTIGMIRRLHKGLGIPAEVLIAPYPLDQKR